MIITNRKKEIYNLQTYEEFEKHMFETYLQYNHYKYITEEIKQKLKNFFKNNERTGLKSIITLNSSLIGIGHLLSIEAWTKRGWSIKEAKQKISEIQSKNAQKFCEKQKQNPQLYSSRTPSQIGYWIKKGYSEIEAKQKVSKRQAVFSKEKLIEKYGEEKGLEKLNERNQKWINSLCTMNHMKKLNKSKGVTLENQILKYGETLGTENYIKYCDTQRSSTINRLKNGEKLLFQTKASKQSIQIFKEFDKKMTELFGAEKIFLGINDRKEYFIQDHNNIYFYDFVIVPLNLIFEYNGSHVHPNKDLLSEKQWNNWRNVFTKQSAQESYDHDQNKKIIAEKMGFDVITLWDSDTIDYNQKIVSESIKLKLNKIL